MNATVTCEKCGKPLGMFDGNTCADCSKIEQIRAEIAEYGAIWVEYKITDKTKTDKGIERLVSDVLSQAKKQVLDIIDKYR